MNVQMALNNATEHLDKMVKRQNTAKRLAVLLVSLTLLGVAGYLFQYKRDKPITEVKGVVIGIDNRNWSYPYDGSFYITIELESGDTARYEIPRESTVKIGDTVLVSPFTFRRISK